MSFVLYNPNPNGAYVGDCTIRALSKAIGTSWYTTYIDLAVQGYMMADMPSSNRVWGQYLMDKGYERRAIPNTCPKCYTIKQFCNDNPRGTYIIGTGTHVVTVKDGDYYDTWDSGDETPIFYYYKEE